MTIRPRRLRLALLALIPALALLAVAVPAQPVSGDLVVADSYSTTKGKIYVLSRTTGFTTLYPGFTNYFPNWVEMAADNRSVFCPFVLGTSYDGGLLARVQSNGVLGIQKVIQADIGFGNGLFPDGTGGLIFAGQQGVLFRFDESTLALTTLGLVPRILNEVAYDRDSGGYLALIYSLVSTKFPGTVVRVDPVLGGIVTTVISQDSRLSRPSAIVFDPTSGDWLISRFDAPGVVRVNPNTFTMSTVFASSSLNSLTITPRNTFLAASETIVSEIDGQGTVLGSTAFPVLLRVMGAVEWGSRRVTVSGSGLPGTKQQIAIRSGKPADAGLDYFLAASLGTRPSVAPRFANGEVLNLAADTLLLLSATEQLPQIFVNFRGALDGNSEAQASINIPGIVPRFLNLPIHVGGVVIDPKAPGGVTTVLSSVTFVLR